MADETRVLQSIRLALGAFKHVRMFRNNTGRLKTDSGRYVDFGLCVGSSDLIGYRSTVVTPEMIGQRIAVFVAIEVKDAWNKTTPTQQAFIDRVQMDGGIAGVCRSVSEAEELCR